MQIPVLNGTYSDESADFRVAYPVNAVPVPLKTSISNGYLRTAEGISAFNTFSMPSGTSRGGINWRNNLYRVIGTKLVRVNENGQVLVLGDVGGTAQVSLDYSFDRLAIASDQKLFYWDGTTLKQVTDTDLGVVVDMIWIDGYFMTTDGTFLVITELNNPFAVDPLKYGSSEADPDPVVGLLKSQNQAVALNRYTTEYFDNVGGDNFPFQRIEGAMIPKGLVGTHAKCLIGNTFAFLGSGRNEPCSVYIAGAAAATKIATREIETIIEKYSEAELATAKLEYRETKAHKHIYVRLPNEVLVYDIAASQVLGDNVWFSLVSDIAMTMPYRGKDMVYVYGNWNVADTVDNRLGIIDDSVATQYGQVVGGKFETQQIYNASMGAIINQLELVGLFGRAELNVNPSVFISWSEDGETWSDERLLSIGKQGDRRKRPQIRQCGRMANWRVYRVRWANGAVASFSRLEGQLEPLAYG